MMSMPIANERLGHVAKILLYLLKSKKPPTVSEVITHTHIPSSTFYYRLRRSLEEAGWVEFRVNPDRTITMHLTEKGRKLAKCLKECEEILKEAGVI